MVDYYQTGCRRVIDIVLIPDSCQKLKVFRSVGSVNSGKFRTIINAVFPYLCTAIQKLVATRFLDHFADSLAAAPAVLTHIFDNITMLGYAASHEEPYLGGYGNRTPIFVVSGPVMAAAGGISARLMAKEGAV